MKKQDDYNSEPVEYCSKCYSLRIKHEDSIDADYCAECGCTETATASIEEWEKLYEGRYGHKYVEKNNDPRNSIYFKMTLEELKKKLYYSRMMPIIINKLYRNFPKGYSRTDSLLLLFDKLIKDNRLDDLRYLLYNLSV